MSAVAVFNEMELRCWCGHPSSAGGPIVSGGHPSRLCARRGEKSKRVKSSQVGSVQRLTCLCQTAREVSKVCHVALYLRGCRLQHLTSRDDICQCFTPTSHHRNQ